MDLNRQRREGLRRRHLRVRKTVKGSTERPRLAVYRSNAHIYAQVIDDTTGRTIAAVSTLTPTVRQGNPKTGNRASATAVGAEIAQIALARGIKKVCFDRGGRQFHGRIKALAEAARKAGLAF